MVMPASLFAQFHGPEGNSLYVRKTDVIAALADTNNPSHTLIYLSNGQQWTVKETPQVVMANV